MTHPSPPKAAHGAACNNCGLCCMDQPCPLSVQVFGFRPGPCLALEPLIFGYGCGLVSHPDIYAPAIVARHGIDAARRAAAVLVGAGRGCDAFTEGEPVDQGFRKDLRRHAMKNSPDAELKIWGFSNGR